jgi:hypothetical protein
MSSNLISLIISMIKKYWVYILFVFAVSLFIFTRFRERKKTNDLVKISVKTFQSQLGWGYDIYKNDSVYIHQEFIPAIAGRKGFATSADAEKIGQLAIAKMKYQHQQLPVILLSELDSCKISR